jgi:hypothetical protein
MDLIEARASRCHSALIYKAVVTHFAPGGYAWQSSWPITASRPTGKGPAASDWPRSVRPWPGSSVRAICLGTWQPPHRTGGPSARRRSGARRELAIPCPSPHAAACVWILSGEQGSRYACPAIVSGPPKYPTYGSLYRVNPTAVPGLLERLTDERGGHGRHTAMAAQGRTCHTSIQLAPPSLLSGCP